MKGGVPGTVKRLEKAAFFAKSVYVEIQQMLTWDIFKLAYFRKENQN